MIDLLLNQAYAANEAIHSIEKQQHKTKIQRLESQVKQLENKVEYFQ